ncbi:MAG TPA: BatA domain-containing protein, partial [Planctomycetaceae bacterium]|nr:BatA domain-containing protein [Planctomycetaceae bacterium]
MSFLSTAFLWALPLIAVPVAIHLLNRRRQEIVRWGAMQFLMDSSIRRRKIWRIDDLVLMLLRTAAVLAVILALARPLWQRAGWGGPGRDVVFVWDVSLSMDRRIDGAPAFDRLVGRTEELFSQLSAHDTVRGLVTIGKGEWLGNAPVPADRTNLAAMLDALKKVGVTGSSADWPACLGTALRVDSPAAAVSKQVVVLSDRQAEGWKANDQSAWSNLLKLAESAEVPTVVELLNVLEAGDVVRNLAVDRLTVTRALLGPGERCRITAEVRNHGRGRIEQKTLAWTADGQSLGTSSAGPWEPGQSSQVAMEFVPTHSGTTLVTGRIDYDDELPLDNSSSLVVEVIDHVPLLIVDDAKENDPLQTDQG